jgi:hypothetical protein
MPVKTGARVDGGKDSYWLILTIYISYNPPPPPTIKLLMWRCN